MCWAQEEILVVVTYIMKTNSMKQNKVFTFKEFFIWRVSNSDVSLESTTISSALGINVEPLLRTFILRGIREVFIFVQYVEDTSVESNYAGYMFQSVGCVLENDHVQITGTKSSTLLFIYHFSAFCIRKYSLPKLLNAARFSSGNDCTLSFPLYVFSVRVF